MESGLIRRRFYLVVYVYIIKGNDMELMIENKVLHYPQLDTILMVETFIREHSGEFKKNRYGRTFQEDDVPDLFIDIRISI